MLHEYEVKNMGSKIAGYFLKRVMGSKAGKREHLGGFEKTSPVAL